MRKHSSRLVAALAVVAAALLATPALALADGWRFQPTINAPWVYGDGDQSLDSASAAPGLCRSAPFNTPTAYAPTTNIDMIVNDPLNLSGVSNYGCYTPQNESSVAVNPSNPRNLVAGNNDYRPCCDFDGLNDSTGWAYTSFDGGNTWTNVQVPGLTAQTGGQGQFAHVDSAGDPSLAFGPNDTVYYANIVFSRVSANSGIAVSVSHDGGLTWGQPNMVSWSGSYNYFNDKEWIAADSKGDVVVTWTEFNQGPQGAGYWASPIVMAVSKDGGQTWLNQGSPVSDKTRPYDQGSMPVFGPDGTLYVAYEATSPSTGYQTDATAIAVSKNLGQTFTNVEVGRVYDDLNCYPSYAGRQTLTGEHFRINSYPSFSVDPSTGRWAVVWTDAQTTCGTSGATSNQVKLVTGSGTSFGGVSTITSGAADKVFPAVAANRGTIAVSYYTRGVPQNANCYQTTDGPTTTPVCLGVAARSSTSGFAKEKVLTTQASNPFVEFANGSFIGDYTGLALGSDGVAHPVWTDFRGNPGVTSANQDAYTQSFRP